MRASIRGVEGKRNALSIILSGTLWFRQGERNYSSQRSCCSGLQFADCSSVSSPFNNTNSSISSFIIALLYNCYLCSIIKRPNVRK